MESAFLKKYLCSDRSQFLFIQDLQRFDRAFGQVHFWY